MRYLAQIAVATTIVVGCATIAPDRSPPAADSLPPAFQVESSKDRRSLDYFYLKMADANKEPKVQWWVEYRRAKLWSLEDSALSCAKFSNLARIEAFPLKSLAALRAEELCARAGAEKPSAIDHSALPKWLASPALEAELSLAKQTQNQSRVSEILIEKSKRTENQVEKLELAQQALTAAQESKAEGVIRRAENRIFTIAPRLKSNPKKSDWLKVAFDFARVREFKRAEKYFAQVTNEKGFSQGQKLSALRGLAQIQKIQRQRREHKDTLARLAKLQRPKSKKKSESWRLYASSIMDVARAEWTDGDAAKARALAEEAIGACKGRTSRAELFWLLGRLDEEKEDYAEAVRHFQLALNEPELQPDLTDKIRWYLAWDLRLQKQFTEAAAGLKLAFENSKNDFAKVRFLYWLGRSQNESGQAADARETFLKLIELDPLGYYGLLSYRELDQAIRLPAAKALPPTTTPSRFGEFVDPQVFEWLLSVEEFDVARDLLDLGTESLRRRDKSRFDESTWTDMFRAYARSGNYEELYMWLGRLGSDRRTTLLERNPELLFPQPFREAVVASAERYQIPAELVFAIMRQESSFNPRARSPADAFGLMQILPEVAEAANRVARVNYARAEDLYTPDVNIPLGAFHLRELWQKFDGQFILAVAAYNANEPAIRGWLKRRFKGDALNFIEDIPYEETRSYIRLVLRNMIFYQLLRSGKSEMKFPEWVFRIEKSARLETRLNLRLTVA